MSETEREKWNIPVSSEAMHAIGELAEKMGRSQAWMTVALIDAAATDRETFSRWLAARAVGQLSDILGGSAERNKRKAKAGRVQVHIEHELAQKVEAIGKDLNMSKVQVAAVLLDCGLRDHRWIIEVVTTPIVKALFGWGKDKAEPKRIEAKIGEKSANFSVFF